MRSLRTRAAVLVLALLIPGCGGGGGGGGAVTPPAITFNGVTTQARLSAANANQFFSLVWNGTSTSGLSPNALRAAAAVSPGASVRGGAPLAFRSLAQRVLQDCTGSAESAKQVNSMVPVNGSQPGAVSGSLALSGSIDDRTGTGALTLSYQNFNDGGGYTYDGVIAVQVNGFDFSSGTLTDLAMYTALLTVRSTGSNLSLSGSVRMQVNPVGRSEILTVNLDGRNNVGNDTFRFTNFQIGATYDLAGPGTTTFSGRVYAQRDGYVEVSTVTPCTYGVGAVVPGGGGPVVLAGASNTRADVTPGAQNRVTIEVDDDGDGAFEARNAYLWSDLTGQPVQVL